MLSCCIYSKEILINRPIGNQNLLMETSYWFITVPLCETEYNRVMLMDCRLVFNTDICTLNVIRSLIAVL